MRSAPPASLAAGPGLLLLVLALCLGGCASGPRGAGPARAPVAPLPSERDGPGIDPPADVADRPDAEPRVETIRPGGPNKPYQVFGRDYVPVARDLPFVERGLASWYGRKFHGRPTANGEIYDMYAMTAAHPTLPIPSYVRIRNPANGREVRVRINDRGPFHPGRIVDLSYAAAAKLDLLRRVAPVELERITFAEIRAGTWRRAGDGETRLASAPAQMSEVVPVGALTSIAATRAESGTSVALPPSSPPAAAPTAPPPAATALAAVSAVSTVPADAPASAEPAAAAAGAFWLQLGAFRERAGAEALQRRLGDEPEARLPGLATIEEAALFRVRAGPFASRELAREAAQRLRDAVGVESTLVERR
jgi:rare lipoprotein A